MKAPNRRRQASRIDPLVDLLRAYWKSSPDLRLGQIVCNLAGKGDPFYAEDDVILKRLKEELDEQLRGSGGQDRKGVEPSGRGQA